MTLPRTYPSPQQAPVMAAPVLAIDNTPQAVFTVPTGTHWSLRGFIITNTTGTAATVTVTVRRSGTTFTLLGAKNVPANNALEWGPFGDFFLMPSEILNITSSTASGLVGRFSLRAEV